MIFRKKFGCEVQIKVRWTANNEHNEIMDIHEWNIRTWFARLTISESSSARSCHKFRQKNYANVIRPTTSVFRFGRTNDEPSRRTGFFMFLCIDRVLVRLLICRAREKRFASVALGPSTVLLRTSSDPPNNQDEIHSLPSRRRFLVSSQLWCKRC